tara:strand:- start:475 stop:729 length:255 start_codon:yes stop_codon:yes gene_type:complete
MFDNVKENLDEHLGRLYQLKENFEDHEFLSESRDLQKIFDNASEMLESLSEEEILRPYKRFLDQFNKVEAMLNEVKARCMFRQH